jgi:BASS family bile acid:Na+ symporter
MNKNTKFVDNMLYTSDILMPIAIAIIMYGIGINLKFKDFGRVFYYPKPIIVGLFGQLVLLPLIAFVLIYYWNIDNVYKVGLIIIASAPGGTASNLITHLMKGRVALSVSLTSLNSFAILLTIPLYIQLAFSVFLQDNTKITLSFSETFIKVLLTVLLPVMAGVLTNHFTKKEFTDKLRKPLKILLPALLLSVFAMAMFFGEDNQSLEFLNNLELIIPLIVFNIITIFTGYYISKAFKNDHSANYTIAIEMGLQNSALAIYVASSLVGNSQMELMAVIYSSFTFFSTAFFALILKRYFKPAN